MKIYLTKTRREIRKILISLKSIVVSTPRISCYSWGFLGSSERLLDVKNTDRTFKGCF